MPTYVLPLSIDADTPVRTLTDSLTDAEVSCIRTELGDEMFEAMLDQPISGGGVDPESFPLQCVAPETAGALMLAVLSAQTGGLSDTSQSCLQAFLAEHGAVAPASDDPAANLRWGLNFQLCLTDEEGQALAPPDDDGSFPSPSELRCVASHTDIENFVTLVSSFEQAAQGGGAPSPELFAIMGELSAAFEACGLEFMTGG